MFLGSYVHQQISCATSDMLTACLLLFRIFVLVSLNSPGL